MSFTCTEHTFQSFDNTSLFFRVWKPKVETKKAVIILHRGHEHSGRVGHIVDELKIEDAWFFSFDMRGHGLSPGERGWAPSFNTWVKDLNAFSIHIRSAFGIEMRDTFVIANSVGSVMAVQWVHDYAPGICGMALAAPAFSINLYVPLALPSLRLLSKFTDQASVSSYVRSSLLTRDPVEAAKYDADQLITKKIAVNVLVSLFDNVKRLMSDAHTIETPTIVLSAGSDYIVRKKSQLEFFEKISSVRKQFVELPGFRHAIFHEKDRDAVVKPVREFILESFKLVDRRLPVVMPEARSFSVQAYQTLKEKPTQAAAMKFFVMRWMLEKFGPLSRGMEIGLKEGFDSAASLDYVYRNKAQGKFGIGRLIDFFFLNAIGWKGIRNRKENLKTAIRATIESVHASGQRPVVMDCAAGFGRYLFESVRDLSYPVDIHIRDINPRNLKAAQALANELGVKNVHCEQADAFKAESFKDLGYKPNVVIVSGLFELFSMNNLLHVTLSGIKKSMQEGGYIVYTGQPWHPQIEMIARVLNNHLGFRWVMRARVQAELDDLVKFVGFEKLDTAMEDMGIFTVSTARNVTSHLVQNVDRKANADAGRETSYGREREMNHDLGMAATT